VRLFARGDSGAVWGSFMAGLPWQFGERAYFWSSAPAARPGSDLKHRMKEARLSVLRGQRPRTDRRGELAARTRAGALTAAAWTQGGTREMRAVPSQLVAAIPGYGAQVTSVAFFPDGRFARPLSWITSFPLGRVSALSRTVCH
jgi:hypothetical protein